MNVVIDTNVFVSGIFWGGIPAEILKEWQQKEIILCLTPNIYAEYSRIAHNLVEKHPHINVDIFLNLVKIDGSFFADIKLLEPVSRDPDDDKFIACALSANSEIIVSGDKDLLDIGKYKNIEILNPKDFYMNYLALS